MFFRCKDANIFPLRQNRFGPFLNALNITSPCARPSASPHPTIPPLPAPALHKFPSAASRNPLRRGPCPAGFYTKNLNI